MQECVAWHEIGVHSMYCVNYKLCMEDLLGGELGAMENVIMVRTASAPRLDREKLARLKYRLISQWFMWDVEQIDLDLDEAKDLLLWTREKQEVEHFPTSDLHLYTSSASLQSFNQGRQSNDKVARMGERKRTDIELEMIKKTTKVIL